LERKEFKKGDFILKEDQVARYIYFIEKGMVRSFRYHNDKEETFWFMKEFDIMVCVESFFPQLPATEFIQAMEFTILHRISFDQLQEAYARCPQFNLHGRVILEKYYMQSLQRENMRGKSALEKYKYLMANQPELVGRVQDKCLASYLGVTPETFSKCALVCDEFATVRAASLLTTIATARSNNIIPDPGRPGPKPTPHPVFPGGGRPDPEYHRQPRERAGGRGYGPVDQ
jgi:CRP-like cAMP-binding protein